MEQLTPTTDLFAGTWQRYKERALPLLAVIVIGMALTSGILVAATLFLVLAGIILTHLAGGTAAMVFLAVSASLLFTIALVVALWCQTALLVIIVDEEQNIIQAFQHGWKKVWSMGWVLSIFAGILLTGFTAAILPGILFLVWFSFCGFILLQENTTGLDSLLKSREYVRGYGWAVLARMLPVWLVMMIISLVPFLGILLSILFTPFAMLYFLSLYRELREIRGPVQLQTALGTRLFWWVLAVIGFILPLIAILGAASLFVNQGAYFWEIEHHLSPIRGTLL